MKATVEIPEAVLREAEAKAAERGIAVDQFVAEAVEEKLAAAAVPDDKPWMKYAGGLSHLHEENVRIQQLIDEEFERTPEPPCVSMRAVRYD